jgi:hypothetical protein
MDTRHLMRRAACPPAVDEQVALVEDGRHQAHDRHARPHQQPKRARPVHRRIALAQVGRHAEVAAQGRQLACLKVHHERGTWHASPGLTPFMLSHAKLGTMQATVAIEKVHSALKQRTQSCKGTARLCSAVV